MKDYVNKCAVEYEPPNRRGFLCLPVLPFLAGKPWDEIAIAYVHSLRPSYIRVIEPGGCETCDGRTWRVTVRLKWLYADKKEAVIKEIVQEVEVGLPERVPHGHALQDALKFGINSPQLDWHRLDGTVFYGFGEYSKITDDGHVPYPRPEK